jgi:hypothetical protein
VNRIFTCNAGVTRGHELKLFKYGCRLELLVPGMDCLPVL